MLKVTSTEFKNNFGHYMRAVRAGKTFIITIRGEAHSVMQAINRQVAHYAYHCGQVVFLAKHLQAGNWKCLSVPRKQSADFNRRVHAGEASQR